MQQDLAFLALFLKDKETNKKKISHLLLYSPIACWAEARAGPGILSVSPHVGGMKPAT